MSIFIYMRMFEGIEDLEMLFPEGKKIIVELRKIILQIPDHLF